MAFADLVGFTALSEGPGAARAGDLAARLKTAAFDALQPGVQVVKLIGDEVMLASTDVPALVATMLELLHATFERPVAVRVADVAGR